MGGRPLAVCGLERRRPAELSNYYRIITVYTTNNKVVRLSVRSYKKVSLVESVHLPTAF